MSQQEEVTIIGSGPAGWTAALYAARANMDPFVLEGPVESKDNPPGGQLMTTTDVENYPGFPEGIEGPELMDNFKKQAKRFGARSVEEKVVEVDFSSRPFWIQSREETEITSESIIISTGASARRLDIPSEDRLFGRGGVSSCAVCDGAIFEGKRMVVIGGGDSAMEDALYLSRYSDDVLVIHRRDELRASKIMGDRVKENDAISILWNTELIKYLDDDGMISGVRLLKHEDGKPKEKLDMSNEELEDLKSAPGDQFELWEEPCGAAFLAIGHTPNTEPFSDEINLDDAGYIQLEEHSHTSTPGVFAAGDCVDHRYQQAVTAAGMGCRAAMDCEQWLESQHAEQQQ